MCMRISAKENEKAILAELGQRIRQKRIARGITQAELAEKCGISASTETRIESGVDSKMSNYIRILSGLNLVDNLDILLPEAQPSFKAIYENKPQRRRVRQKKSGSQAEWIWGEDR